MFNSDDLYNIIKNIVSNVINSKHLCDWCYGYVKDTNPFTVYLNEKIIIDKDYIEFGNKKTENININDKLILLRKAGGQRFLLFDVIKEEGE